MQRRRTVTAPASSANLGPGYDCLALALAPRLTLEVVETGQFAVETELDVARGRDNLVVRAFETLHPADGFSCRISSQIPLSGGLGSSAAAIVAGLAAADSIFELDADLLAAGTALDGHADNVAAALHGGLVACSEGRAQRLPLGLELEALLVVPDRPVTTSEARAALPATVPIGDAVFNIACGAQLAAGLAAGDLELIAAGLHDRLHQPARAHLYPRSSELLGRARELGALGATISGAGPTVMVWCTPDQSGAVAAALWPEIDGWARLVRAPVTTAGVDIVAL